GGLTPGKVATISSAVTSAGSATALVDVEVYSSAGSKVGQQFWNNQAFAAGQTRNYTSVWTAPSGAADTYSVRIAIFAPGWGPLYAWNGSAATFSVSTPTAVPTPTATTWILSSTESPASVSPGNTVSATGSVGSPAAATVLVDLEVYDPSGAKV